MIESGGQQYWWVQLERSEAAARIRLGEPFVCTRSNIVVSPDTCGGRVDVVDGGGGDAFLCRSCQVYLHADELAPGEHSPNE